jgi:hypothetical protein
VWVQDLKPFPKPSWGLPINTLNISSMTKNSTKSNINPHWFSIEKQVVWVGNLCGPHQLSLWKLAWGFGKLPRPTEIGLFRAASHYGRRSRGRWFPAVRLQEIKNSASRPFTLEVEVQRPALSKMPTWQYFFTKATDSQRKFGLDRNGNPNYGREAVNFFSITN